MNIINKTSKYVRMMGVITLIATSLLVSVFATAAQNSSYVSTGRLNIRSGPGISYGIIATITQGDTVTLLGRNADASWLEVRLTNNQQGWARSRYIVPNVPIGNLPITSPTVPNPAPSSPLYPGQTTYVVQPGDNLFRIALRYNLSTYTLAAANNIYNYNLIYTGQILVIPRSGQPANPGGRSYTVQPGDTLAKIAAQYGVNIYALAQRNNIYNLNLVYTGQVLWIP